MDKSKAGALAQVESNEISRERDTELRDQVRTLSDFEMMFVGGGDDTPGWHP